MKEKLRVGVNAQIDTQVLALRSKVRTLKVHGTKERDLRGIDADITHVEVRYLREQCGNKY